MPSSAASRSMWSGLRSQRNPSSSLNKFLTLDRLKRRDPLQALLGFEVIADARRGEHPAIADQHDLLQAETLAQFLDLRRDGLGIACVALEDLHSDGAALRVGHQSEDDLQVAAAFIAGMAEAGERAAAAFKVSGADVVEDQRALGKMAFGGSVFDFLLAPERPIQGVIELGFLDGGVQTEQGRQRGGGGVRMKAAGGSEFGGGFEDAGDDHDDDEMTLGATGGREDGFQKEAAEGTESGRQVAGRGRTEDMAQIR